MADKVIVSVAAVCGADAVNNPREIADDVIACAKAGAAMVHLHVRDYNNQLTDDLSVIKETIDMIKAESNIIIQISTGGVSDMNIVQRCAPLKMKEVEATSLNVGSVNLGNAVYRNPIDDVKYCVGRILEEGVTPEVEVFELGMINTTEKLRKEFNFKSPLLYAVVLGHEGEMPGESKALMSMLNYLPENEDTLWGITHANRRDFGIVAAALGMGASVVRIGFEDSKYIDKDTISEKNLPLVEKTVKLIKAMDKTPATPDEARKILNITAR